MSFSCPSRRFLLLLLIPATAWPSSLVNDRRMETAAKSSYIYHTVLQGRVKASAEFGVLTLTGSVEDQTERLLAEDLARSLQWVEGIENKIILLPSYREKSDPWIRLKILARLRLRAGVNADTTSVVVMDGMVTLTGTVFGERQKALTGQIADEIVGVHHVRNNLLLTPPAAGETVPAEEVDDPSLVAQVLAALRAHEPTRSAVARVTAEAGEVRIIGQAESDEQKVLVTQYARQVRGVRSVINTMKSSQ